jgi:Tfp pilus assembly protein PilE
MAKTRTRTSQPTLLAFGGQSSKGYSLTELIIIIVFLGVLAAIAVPRFNFSSIIRQKADCQARKIVTDLRRTRGLAISNAADSSAGYALNMTGSVPGPYTGYQIVDINGLSTVDSYSIDSAVTCTGGSHFQFNYLGNLKTGSDTQLKVSAEGKKFTIDITRATGMIKCTEN